MTDLLQRLPATAAELVEATGRSQESVYGELVHLEARGLARVEVVHTGKQVVACEWHRGWACDPSALCLASRDGFCDAPLGRALGTGERA